MIFKTLAPLFRVPAAARLSRDALLALEPETAHRATITALKLGLAPISGRTDPPSLRTALCGLTLANPLGLAAGFDKNAEVPEALGRLGFGMVEIGTVTPRPQQGNPRPRLFRIPEAEGVVNRMGFNNEGHEAVLARLQGVRIPGVLGVNVGANKDSDDFVADYRLGVERFAPVADYITANVSSPNTPGLRDLQADEALKRLLEAVLEARARAPRRVPVFLKIAPDLDEAGLDGVARTVLSSDLDGLIVSNTTLSRLEVEGLPNASERGGLSGRPLFALSTRRLAQVRQRVGRLPIIGAGGIDSAQTALEKIEAGANAIQLYSAMVFKGFGLIEEICEGLAEAVTAAGKTSIAELVGRRTDALAG